MGRYNASKMVVGINNLSNSFPVYKDIKISGLSTIGAGVFVYTLEKINGGMLR